MFIPAHYVDLSDFCTRSRAKHSQGRQHIDVTWSHHQGCEGLKWLLRCRLRLEECLVLTVTYAPAITLSVGTLLHLYKVGRTQPFNTADISGLHQDCPRPYICLSVTVRYKLCGTLYFSFLITQLEGEGPDLGMSVIQRYISLSLAFTESSHLGDGSGQGTSRRWAWPSHGCTG